MSTPSNRPLRAVYLRVAWRFQHFLNVCTGGRLNYWRNHEVIERSGLFSAEYYVRRYGEFIPRGMSPLKHYLTQPWNTPFNPSPDFDGGRYLEAYPPVAYWRHHPFVDYVRIGRKIGRHARQPTWPTIEELQIATTRLATSRFRSFLETHSSIAIPASDEPRVSIILLLRNRAELTLLCLESIAATADVPLEVVIIDNASTDDTPLLLQRVSGVRVFRNEQNTGFGPAVNQAASLARGEFLLLLNNDTEVLPGAIRAALETAESAADIGAVGGRIILLDGRLQEAGSVVWRGGVPMGLGRGLPADDPSAAFRKEVDYCSGCFLLIERQTFLDAGGFHSRYAPAYFEDADLCLTLWESGKRVLYEPTAAIVHFESASSTSRDAAQELIRRHQPVFAAAHDQLLRDRPKVGELDGSLSRFLLPGAAERRRVLVIDDFPPVPLFGSGLVRANTVVRALTDSGYEVTVAHTAGNPFTWPEVYEHIDRGVEVTPVPLANLTTFLHERLPFYSDILVSRPNNLRAVLQALDTRRRRDGKPRPRLIYDAEALYGERQRLGAELQRQGRNGRAPAAAGWTTREELQLAARADAILSVSPREAEMLRRATGKPVQMLGHSVAAAPTPATWAERHTILFVGSLHAVDQPNYDSLAWFFREVAPLLPEHFAGAAGVVIAGYRAEGIPLLKTGAFQVDWLGKQEDLTPIYNNARVFIAPTRYAAGIPYKCLEAASRGVPIVATQVLADQLEWEPSRDLLVADHRHPERFATALASLYGDEQQWELVRAAALARVATELSPQLFQQQAAAVFPPVQDRVAPIRSRDFPVAVR